MSCLRFVISGMVQGVGFRYATLIEARRFNISGSVRNTASGKVEVLARGDEHSLQQFERFLRRGPAYARVTEVSKEEYPGNFFSGEFKILP